jgi:hypothetical protein
MDVLIGSSCPPPNASNESAKAVSPLNASPRAALFKKKKKEAKKNKTRNQQLPNAKSSTLLYKSIANKHIYL